MPQAQDEAGNIWEVDAQGNAVRLIRAASAAPQMPADPTFPLQAPKVAAEIENTQTNTADTVADNERQQTELIGALYVKGLRPDGKGGVEPIPNWRGPPGKPQQPAMSDNVRSAMDLLRIIDGEGGLQEQFDTNFSDNGAFGSLGEFSWFGLNPNPAVGTFESKANSALPYVKKFMRTPGEGAQSDKDAAVYQALLPSPNARDATNAQRIDDMRQSALSILRQQGLDISGYDATKKETRGPEWFDRRPNALAIPRIVQGSGPTAAGFGATEGGQPVPPGYQQAYEAFVRTGNFTPEQYAAFRQQLDQQFFGEAAPQTDTYREEGARILETLQRGGDLNLTVPPTEAPLSDLDQLRNNVAANPLGAALIGAADMGSLGGVSALAPGQMQALGDAGGWTGAGLLAGQIGGAIGGTAAIGRLGKETLGRIAPKLLGGGKVAQFGRNLAEDVAYSGVYGTTTGQDPLATAAQGGAGSVLGQGMGSALGRAVSGVTSSPTISRLRDLGVTPSLGQIMRGRAADNSGRSMVAGIEDVIANNGAVGTFVNNARGRALEDANLAGFNIVSDGRPVTAIGEQGLDQLDTIKTDAYSDALSGVSVPTNDPRFVGNVASAARMGEAVDAARGRGDFTYIMDNELAPILGVGPNYSGDQLQDALRLLQGQSRAYRKAASGAAPDPAAAGVSRALEKVGDALGDLASTYSPDTLPKLQSANAIYRGLQVLDDASGRAMNEGGVWTAAQLGQAIKANTQAFEGKGLRKAAKSPLYQLQQDMQAVLPNKVPPTGVNAAPMLALGGAALGGAGYATDNDALKYAALLGLAAAPYTKAGQKAVAKALLDRPDKVKELGKAIRKKKGLFGSATLPFTLPQ